MLSQTLDYRATLAKVADLVVPRLADWCVLLIADVRGKGLAAVRTPTIVLGVFRAAAADGDDVVNYTDGVIEARDPQRRFADLMKLAPPLPTGSRRAGGAGSRPARGAARPPCRFGRPRVSIDK